MSGKETRNTLALIILGVVLAVGIVATYTIAHGGDVDEREAPFYRYGSRGVPATPPMGGGMMGMGMMNADHGDEDMMPFENGYGRRGGMGWGGMMGGMMGPQYSPGMGGWDDMPCHQQLPTINGVVQEVDLNEQELIVQAGNDTYEVHVMGAWVDSQGRVMPGFAVLQEISEGDSVSVEATVTPCGMVFASEIVVDGERFESLAH